MVRRWKSSARTSARARNRSVAAPRSDSRHLVSIPSDPATQLGMKAFCAASASELREALRAADVDVPLRTRGRTTCHTETWVTCRFLATLARADLLRFPLRVEPGDRPDLVLAMPSGRTGIEITEAVPQDKARVDAYSEHKGIDDFRFIPRYRVGDPRRSPAEIEAIATGRARTLPIMGDALERDWADAMVHFIERKAAGFDKPGFARHSRNWLLIYDNWCAGLDEQVATLRLSPLVFTRRNNPFSRVFVQRPRSLLEFAPGTGAVIYPVNLIRFGGHLNIAQRRCPDVEETTAVRAGVPAPDGGAGSHGAHARGAGS